MVVLNVVLMALISAAIVGLLVWSIFTQHRHYGCVDLRIRRRLPITLTLVEPGESKLGGGSSTITEI